MLVPKESLTLISRGSLMKRLKNKLKAKRVFYLSGISGIGKTELLSFAYWECSSSRKIFIDINESTFSEVIKSMAKCQGIQLTEGKKRKTLVELEMEILKGQEMYIFIDNFHKFSPKQCDYLLKKTFEKQDLFFIEF